MCFLSLTVISKCQFLISSSSAKDTTKQDTRGIRMIMIMIKQGRTP